MLLGNSITLWSGYMQKINFSVNFGDNPAPAMLSLYKTKEKWLRVEVGYVLG